MRLSLLPPLCALVALGACAPASGPPTGGGRPTTVLTTGGGYDIHIAEDGAATTDVVAASREAVWSALVASYAELGLEVNHLDSASGQMGLRSVRVPRRVGGERLSTYLDCGTGLSGTIADTYRVTLTMLTGVAPGAGGMRLTTDIAAQAVSNEGASGAPVRCSTKGRLEERLHAMVRERAGS